MKKACLRAGGQACGRWICSRPIFGRRGLAIQAAKALKAQGLKVGEQLSLIGYDNSPEAQAFTPAFATVEVPLEEVGRLLVQGAMQSVEDPKRPYAVQEKARAILPAG